MYSHFIAIKLLIPALLQFVLQVVQQALLFCSTCIFVPLFKGKYIKKEWTQYITLYKTTKWKDRVKKVPVSSVH